MAVLFPEVAVKGLSGGRRSGRGGGEKQRMMRVKEGHPDGLLGSATGSGGGTTQYMADESPSQAAVQSVVCMLAGERLPSFINLTMSGSCISLSCRIS